VLAALASGQTVFGENRVQEAAQKFPPAILAPGAAAAHHRRAADQQGGRGRAHRDVIESLDRRASPRRSPPPPAKTVSPACWCRSTRRGTAKSGIAATTRWLHRRLQARFGSALTPDVHPPPGGSGAAFRLACRLRAQHGLVELSMGMSGDFEVAIAHGATLVRVGTAIFGHRPG